MSETMNAVVWDGGQWPNGLEYKEFSKPEVRPNWVLVKNQAAGICGSDLHYLSGETRDLIPDENLPAVLGHENAGIVVDTGPGVEGLEQGDRVAAEPLHGCIELDKSPVCPACRKGQYHLCDELTHVGIPLVEMLPGGYGEYSIFHESRLFHIPDNVSFEAAALIDVLAVGIHAMAVGNPAPGKSVAVLGSGVIGLDLMQCLKAWGVRDIIATAKYPFQADAARKAGANKVVEIDNVSDTSEVIMEMTEGKGVDEVYEAVGGNTDVIEDAVSVCRTGGSVIMTGIFDGSRPVNLQQMLFKEVDILSANSYSMTGMKRDFQIALDLLKNRQVVHDFLTTHTFPLTSWRDAIGTAFSKGENKCLRAVMKHEGV